MAHETFYLRAPDESSAQKDIEAALEAAGVDPSKVLTYDEDGEITGWNTSLIAAFGPGEWAEREAEYDEDGNQTQERIDGDHFILTGRTDDAELKNVVESFSATDPKTDPADVPDSDKAEHGTSRIEPPETPIRPIAV